MPLGELWPLASVVGLVPQPPIAHDTTVPLLLFVQ